MLLWCLSRHVHMYVDGKMKPVETPPRMGGGEIKGEWWRG
jgi:hypothetical protein